MISSTCSCSLSPTNLDSLRLGLDAAGLSFDCQRNAAQRSVEVDAAFYFRESTWTSPHFAHNHCVNRRKTVSAQASHIRLSLPISKLAPIRRRFIYSIEVCSIRCRSRSVAEAAHENSESWCA